MDETSIANQVSQNIPAVEPVAIAPADVLVQPDGITIIPADLDELTMFKFHDYFGENWSSSNEDNKERIQYIFDKLSEQIGERDYLKVMSRVSEIEQLMGTSHSDNRIYKLYQWLGFDSIRRNSETAMRLING
jgi:hypothetical protein